MDIVERRPGAHYQIKCNDTANPTKLSGAPHQIHLTFCIYYNPVTNINISAVIFSSHLDDYLNTFDAR